MANNIPIGHRLPESSRINCTRIGEISLTRGVSIQPMIIFNYHAGNIILRELFYIKKGSRFFLKAQNRNVVCASRISTTNRHFNALHLDLSRPFATTLESVR